MRELFDCRSFLGDDETNANDTHQQIGQKIVTSDYPLFFNEGSVDAKV